jgi:hypothetical protein
MATVPARRHVRSRLDLVAAAAASRAVIGF